VRAILKDPKDRTEVCLYYMYICYCIKPIYCMLQAKYCIKPIYCMLIYSIKPIYCIKPTSTVGVADVRQPDSRRHTTPEGARGTPQGVYVCVCICVCVCVCI
jgi:hypothetical protein